MARYLTLAPNNEFRFECPVFNAQTKMASCMALREAVWAGRILDKRRGCQAAMHCGMCPAARIVDKISYARELASDDYGSLEPKVGRLHADVLERIKNIIPIQRELDRVGISPEERELLMSMRPRVEAQLKTAPRNTGYVAPKAIRATIYEPSESRGDRSKRTIVQAEPHRIKDQPARVAPKVDTSINEAARSGDLAAAINAAA